jgi:hypothetical protein
MKIYVQIRYLVFIPYLIFIGMMGGNILAESIVVGLALAIYDFFFGDFGE